MPVRKSDAIWNGDLKNGNGIMKFGSGAYEGAYTYASRFENGKGTNPEELIGAAHAGCFSMAFAADLAKKGYKPETVETTAEVTIEKGTISINLISEATVPGIDNNAFQEIAEGAKKNCPVSKALAATDITLNATLR